MDRETIKNRVEWVFNNFPESIDDRRMLLWCYWEKFNNLKVVDEEFKKDFLYNVTNMYSISRSCRMIKEEKEKGIYEDISNDMSIKYEVDRLMMAFPDTKDNVKELILAYWDTVDLVDIDINFEKAFLDELDNFYSIDSVARELQKEEKYKPSKEVEELRRGFECEMWDGVKKRKIPNKRII